MVYVVVCNDRVSREAYASFEEARAFIKGRADRPVEVNPYLFCGQYVYEIHEVSVKK